MESITRLAVLGCTGSIGKQTLEVVRSLPGLFKITAVSANRDAAGLEAAAREFSVSCAGLRDERAPLELPCEIYRGADCNRLICQRDDVDMVLIAVSGMEGIFALLAAIENKKKIALANKESIVCAGELVKRALEKHGGRIIPVDSEHSAIFQCLQGIEKDELESITLTASGGAFRDFTKEQLEHATCAQALRHPNWSMGKKITIDCATMANKGLEVIEAHFLFDLPADKINVAIHPQSVIHSMIHTRDGAVLAQLGAPDMRLPIQYALTYPRRMPCICNKLDIFKTGALTFLPPDNDRFPALGLAYGALRAGGMAPAVFNAANERAVELFMQNRISYNEITSSICGALEHIPNQPCQSLEQLLEFDARARAFANKMAERSVV